MRDAPFEIKSNILLIVEGQDEYHFFLLYLNI